jgi:2-polyprenyl-3-methyl-5-hydroxy-6-metoxy-1,4-benzoquinol methylase
MTDLLQYILDYIEKNNFAHASRLKSWIDRNDIEYASKATSFFNRYKSYIESKEKTIDYGIDCYLKLCTQMLFERLEFLRSGKYANSSFEDVKKRIYLNPEMFEYHMHGLVFAQFLWQEQWTRFEFFSSKIGSELKSGSRYLEIGGGHALYILEAINNAPENVFFQLVDISPSSIELAKGITEGLKIEFQLKNILDFRHDDKFDFITMGEVIEHVEDPLSLLIKVRELLAPGGMAYITAPANAPTIDHIYLFNNADEIKAMVKEAGFHILSEKVQWAENANEEKARKFKIALMYAAFVKP